MTGSVLSVVSARHARPEYSVKLLPIEYLLIMESKLIELYAGFYKSNNDSPSTESMVACGYLSTRGLDVKFTYRLNRTAMWDMTYGYKKSYTVCKTYDFKMDSPGQPVVINLIREVNTSTPSPVTVVIRNILTGEVTGNAVGHGINIINERTRRHADNLNTFMGRLAFIVISKDKEYAARKFKELHGDAAQQSKPVTNSQPKTTTVFRRGHNVYAAKRNGNITYIHKVTGKEKEIADNYLFNKGFQKESKLDAVRHARRDSDQSI